MMRICNSWINLVAETRVNTSIRFPYVCSHIHRNSMACCYCVQSGTIQENVLVRMMNIWWIRMIAISSKMSLKCMLHAFDFICAPSVRVQNILPSIAQALSAQYLYLCLRGAITCLSYSGWILFCLAQIMVMHCPRYRVQAVSDTFVRRSMRRRDVSCLIGIAISFMPAGSATVSRTLHQVVVDKTERALNLCLHLYNLAECGPVVHYTYKEISERQCEKNMGMLRHRASPLLQAFKLFNLLLYSRRKEVSVEMVVTVLYHFIWLMITPNLTVCSNVTRRLSINLIRAIMILAVKSSWM